MKKVWVTSVSVLAIACGNALFANTSTGSKRLTAELASVGATGRKDCRAR